MFYKLKTCLSALAVALGATVSLMATPALAAPVTWTIPATPVVSSGTPTGGSISGTFVFDASLPEADRLISINVVEQGPAAATYSFTGGVSAGGQYYVGQTSAVGVAAVTPVIGIDLMAIPSTGGGTYVVPRIYLDSCRNESSGKCYDFSGARGAQNVTISSGGPAAVPTMTEWSMILMGIMLAGAAAVLVQRRRLTA